ncbi:MAG: beta-lactamase family protein [Flavobacteriales bacterium]|jgi:CubicO group peptidase (beta-lactamase class C family)|nr:beta-lactamase family protein [Flavobacteriales bacterium]MBK9699501.1 beta-lactamase family protein [Flavobacteriales bacterium]
MRIPLLGLSLLPGIAVGQTLDQQLQSVATANGLVGMSVVTTCGTAVQDVVHTGKRDLALNLDVDDSTRYRIASISKLVTAIGLMRLYEQGAFGLDDDVSIALGFTFRNPAHPSVPITYRMLLSHRSSFQDGTGYGDFQSATYGTTPPPPISELALPGGDWYTANMWRTEAPGSYFAYSNANYGIIGTLVEALSGQRFDLYMRQQVLLPLGIHGSYNVQDLPGVADLAALYRNSTPQSDNFGGVMPPAPDLSQYVIGTNGLFFAPQGGLRVSALELARFAILLANEGTYDGTILLQPATLALMLGDEWTWDGSNGDNYYGLFRSWGLGVHRITAQPGGDVVFPQTAFFGHAGEAYGLISDLYVDLSSGFGLVFITNGYTPGNAYQFGTNSAFYGVEEDVYGALLQHALPPCTLTGVDEGAAEHDLLLSGDRITWTGQGSVSITLYDMSGRSLEHFTLSAGSTRMVAPGAYLVRSASRGREGIRAWFAQ